MKIHLQYGTDGIEINLPDTNTTVFNPKFLNGLPDEAAGFRAAIRNPINCQPLREIIKPTDKVAVVIPDLTRPLPTEKLFHPHRSATPRNQLLAYLRLGDC